MKGLPRGVYLFALIWLIVLLVPPLRGPLRQALPSSLGAPFGRDAVDSDFTQIETSDTPGDPVAHIQWVENHAQVHRDESSSSLLDPLFALVEKYPNLIWLKADALRLATQGGVHLELDPKLYPPVELTHPNQPPWLTDKLAARCVAIARAGARQDPENAYFPVMEALFCFGSHQEAAGWSALARAGSCRNFNDYTLLEAQRRCDLLERTGPLSWQQRWIVISGIMLPHFAPLRELAWLIASRAQAARNLGNYSLAWQRYEAGLALGRAIRLNPPFYIQALVGEAIEDDIWRAALGQEHTLRRPTGEVRLSEYHVGLANHYAALIRSWGAPESVVRISRHDARVFLSLRLGRDSDRSLTPAPLGELRGAVQGRWLAGCCAALAWLGAAVWLAGQWPRHMVKRGPPGRVIGACTLFACAAITLAAFTAACTGAIGGSQVMRDLLGYREAGPGTYSGHEFAALLLLLWIAAPLLRWLRGETELIKFVGGSAAKEQKTRHFGQWVRYLMWCLGLGFAILAATVSASDWDRVVSWPPPLYLSYLCFGLAVAPTLVRWAKYQPTGTWRQRHLRVLSMHHGMRSLVLLAEVSGRMSLVFSLAYLLAGLCLWPVNADLDRRVRDLENRGEVAVLSDQVNGH